MVKGQGEDVFRGSDTEQCQSHQRGNIQLEPAAPFRLEISVQTGLLLTLRQTAPILLFALKAHVTVHLLTRQQSCPVESGSQNRVPPRGAIPGLAKRCEMDFFGQGADDLFDVHSGVGCGEPVKEHSLLHRRERIAFLDIVRCRCFFWAQHIVYDTKSRPWKKSPKVGEALKDDGELTPPLLLNNSLWKREQDQCVDWVSGGGFVLGTPPMAPNGGVGRFSLSGGADILNGEFWVFLS